MDSACILRFLNEDIDRLVEDISLDFYDDLEELDLNIDDVDFWSAELSAKLRIQTFIRTKVLKAIQEKICT